jgi:copper transport protein
MPRGRSRHAAVVAASTFAAAVALTFAPPALGHATLVQTSPADGSSVTAAPATVTLRFSEQVETGLGSIRVLDSAGRRVDTETLSRPTPEMVSVGLRAGLPKGTYTVTWRVVSGDSHPIVGAFVFGIGVTPTTTVIATAPAAAATSVEQSFRLVRFVHYLALLLLAGGVVALATVLRTATTHVRRALWGIVAATAVALALTSMAGVVLEGASAGGSGIADALDVSVVRAVIGTRFGQVWTWQAIAALGLVVLALASRVREDVALRVASLTLAAALVVTPALTGHAAVSGRLAQLADIAHVGAAAVWIGGLAFLTAGLTLAASGRRELAALAVPRFSRIALASVVLLLVGGVTSAATQIGPVDGLWETTYGKLILVKSALVLVLIGFGVYHRRRLPELGVRASAVELVVMAAAVAATAVLAGEPPAKASTSRAAGPYATEARIGPYDLNLVVTPARVGANAVHLYLLDDESRPVTVDDVRVAATYPRSGIGPLRSAGTPAGPGHYLVSGLQLTIAGEWRLRIDVLKGDFDLFTTTVTAPVR